MAALTSSLFSLPALSHTFQPYVSAEITHDDNLFRVSEDQSGRDGNDTYRSVIGGLKFERPVSRQVFSGLAEFSSVKFDRNSQLDYTGKNLGVDWHWFVGKHFEGHVASSYVQVLAPFSDFHADERNLRTNKKQYVSGSWRFHPSWQWRANYIKDQYSYDLSSQFVDDRTEDALTAGIDYLASSGSTVGFQLRRLKGDYPSQQLLGSNVSNNGYVQNEAKLSVFWLATGSTQIQFLGGWVQRKQNAQAERVGDGTNARTVINWSPAKRVKMVGQAWREFAAIDGALVDSALTTGSSVQATWDFSEKIQAVANIRHEKRKFNPAGNTGETLAAALLTDSSNVASVGLTYEPLRGIKLKANVFRERRAGSVAAGTNSYNANGASIKVSKEF